jgi:hypothetical protein
MGVGEEEIEAKEEPATTAQCSPYRSSSLATFKDLSKRKRWAYVEEFLA